MNVYDAPDTSPAPRHSGLGVAAFVIGLATGILEFLFIMIAGIAEAATPGGLDEEAPLTMLLGCVILLGLIAALAGLGLGIAGVAQRNASKVFAVLGVVFNGCLVLGIGMLVLIGLLAP